MKKVYTLILSVCIFIIFGCKQENVVELERIFISKMPNETSFFCGEELDLDGLEVVGVYSDGTIKTISDYTTEPQSGDLITTDSNFEVYVSFENKECSFPLNVVYSYFDVPVIIKQPSSWKALKSQEVILDVDVEEPLEGCILYQWYESIDNVSYKKVYGGNEKTLRITENTECKKTYYVKITHSYTIEEEGNSRVIDPSCKKASIIKSDNVVVEFYEPIKIVTSDSFKSVDLYSTGNIQMQCTAHIFSDNPILFEWYRKAENENDNDTLLKTEVLNLNNFSEITYTTNCKTSVSIFKKHRIESHFVYVRISSSLNGEKFEYVEDIELKSLPNTGLKLLDITTEDSVEPTCRYLRDEGVTSAYATVDKVKVPGRIVLSYNSEVLYDSGEYENKKSGMTIKIRGNGSAYHKKKGFKIKLQKKSDLLLRNNKSYNNKNWALLADGTSLNTMFGFMVSDILGFEWTPKYEYVDLVINGSYRGVYMLVESIEEDDSRISVSDTGYILEEGGNVSLEAMYETLETPSLYFVSKMKKPYSFKFPDDDDNTQEKLDYIKGIINDFEISLKNGNYSDYIDLNSWVSWYLVQDIIGQKDVVGTNKFISKYDNSERTLLKMETPWDFEYLFVDGLKMQQDTKFYTQSLFNNSNTTFVQAYKEKWNIIAPVLAQQVSEKLEAFKLIYLDSLDRGRLLDNKRWGYTITTLEEEIDDINNWILRQIPVITERCEIF